ncbi:MAG: FAD-dependent oxidoreductase [Planctomycetales bacterium]|nr:FAD-dependent oxidoreductase [Planctomycetales bacterium]MBN8624312.1 FAD-dependent oxidoreductase [Planctomycetota bacterium]
MSDRFTRRAFGQAAAGALGAFGAAPQLLAAAADAKAEPAGPEKMQNLPAVGSRTPTAGNFAAGVFHEAARDVPIVEECDVIVCGAGPAGIAAAVNAARGGAKTRLLEVHGCLGGVWTAGALTWILDYANKPGLMAEIVRHLEARYAQKHKGSVAYDVEQMKLLLEELVSAVGVRVQLHTRVVAALKDKDNRLSLVVTESKSGRQAWKAKTFIDCTGDGDLAALAGCGFDYGSPDGGLAQPMSLMALLTGLKPEEVTPFTRELAESGGWAGPKDRLKAEMEKGGHSPSYAKPTMFHLREDLFALMANHEYGVSAMDAGQITAATMRARGELHKLVNGLRGLGGVWQNVKIVATGEQIGVREGRRIRGLYEVSTNDLAIGVRHKDAVCRVTFGIDVHSTDPTKTKGIEAKPVKSRPYDIPYRALVAKDCDGLLLAGRCISGDFIAHSSYRVTGNSVALGEAAGAAAAVAAMNNTTPRETDFEDIRPTWTRLQFEQAMKT